MAVLTAKINSVHREYATMTRLEYLRRNANVKQQDLARQLGFSVARLNQLERGYAKPAGVGEYIRTALERYFDMPFLDLMKHVE
jgi:DNA-binding transcriptional regulator YiaG